MTNRDIGAEILEGLKEIQEYKKGKIQAKDNQALCAVRTKSHSLKVRIVTIGVCWHARGKPAYPAGLGTRETASARPGYCPPAHCRATSERVCGFEINITR